MPQVSGPRAEIYGHHALCTKQERLWVPHACALAVVTAAAAAVVVVVVGLTRAGPGHSKPCGES